MLDKVIALIDDELARMERQCTTMDADELYTLRDRVVAMRKPGQRKDGESSAAYYARRVLAGGPRLVDALAAEVVEYAEKAPTLDIAAGEVAKRAREVLTTRDRPRAVDVLARHVLLWEPAIEWLLRLHECGRAERHQNHAAGCGDVDVPSWIYDELSEFVVDRQPEGGLRGCPISLAEQFTELREGVYGDGSPAKKPTGVALSNAWNDLHAVERYGGRLRPYCYANEEGGVRAEFDDGLRPAIIEWAPNGGRFYPLDDVGCWGA